MAPLVHKALLTLRIYNDRYHKFNFNFIKPFLSKKACGGGNEVILCKKDKIVSEQPEVCELFNDHFVNVAKDIGKSSDHYKDDFSDHPSITKILENTPQCESDQKFTFKPVGEKYIHKIISNFNVKKATGADNISAKILKSCSSSISSSIANLVNKSFETCKFPNFMKKRQVLPLYKKKDPLNKENYRPVSVLPTISKIF